jgi:hypothetical protein
MTMSFACFPLMLWLAIAGMAQGFWEKKALADWSPQECKKLLTDSPWAKSRTLGNVLIEEIGNPASVDGREGNPWMSYSARFWSARPVRQAYVRQLESARDYVSLPPEQKQSIAAQNDRMLKSEYPDRIVLVLVCATNVDSYKRDLIRYWQTRPPALWAMDTFLLTGKGRIKPLGVAVAPGSGDQLELTFPRTIDGQPVISPNDKSISLELVHPDIGVLRTERLLFNFKVKEMTLGGKVIY